MESPKCFDDWLEARLTTIENLNKLAYELDTMERRVDISRLAGASGSIVCGVGAISCFVAAFFTAGITIIPGIVFASVGGGSGVTSLGARVGKHFHEKKMIKEAQRALNEDARRSRLFNEKVSKWNKTNVTRGAITVGKVIAGAVDFADTIASTAIKASPRALATAGKVAAHVGIYLNLPLLAYDIHDLVTTAMRTHNGSKHEVARELREISTRLQIEMEKMMELHM